LTAARFDLLYKLEREPLGGLLQSQLRRVLGVTGATVSRMLRSLEGLGLVARWRPTDRRQRWVQLTQAGLSRIHCGIFHTISMPALRLGLDIALARERWYCTSQCLIVTDALEAALNSIRAAFGDSATLYYPWHPDD
jgi:DNA-binding MarR family transcriptional regulator